QFHMFDMTWLAFVPGLARVACWTTLLIECGYPFLIWSARTRVVWLPATIGLHVAIALVLGLHYFGAVLVVLNVAAFGWAPLSSLGRTVRSRWVARRDRDRAAAAA